MSEGYFDSWEPCDRTDHDVCECRFHRTMRAIAILRQAKPGASIDLIDRKTNRPLYRVLPDGEIQRRDA